MKDKSWIIILIMGIALAISLGYSIVVSQKTKNIGESTVTTTSIIEMKASTVTIKNTLTGTGNIEYKEKDNSTNIENQENSDVQENINETENNENVEVDLLVKDGDQVKKGQLMGTVKGDIRILLVGERTGLNYLQRMSGIAT